MNTGKGTLELQCLRFFFLELACSCDIFTQQYFTSRNENETLSSGVAKTD